MLFDVLVNKNKIENTTFMVETCSGSRWVDIYIEENIAFKEAIKNANASKKDVYIIKIKNKKEEQIVRVYHHFIDNFGYYNPTKIWDLRTGDTYYVSHNVEYCSNIKGYYCGKTTGNTGYHLEKNTI